MSRKFQVTVIGDANPSAEQYETCYEIGKMIARLGAIAISGGRIGIMEAISKGATEAGGIAVGIVPTDSIDDGNQYNTATIPTGIGHTRNSLTAMAGDVIIAIGGGAGTLSEIAFSWIYKKPVIVFKGFGGWSDQLSGVQLDKRRNDKIMECENLACLEEKLIAQFNILRRKGVGQK